MSLRFQTKLILFYIILFATVEIATLALVYGATKSHIVEQSHKDFLAVRSNLENWLAQTTQNLADAAIVLASDFGFRSAVATEDKATVRSAIENLNARIGADRSWVFSPEGVLLADSGSLTEEVFPYTEFLAGAEWTQPAAAVAPFDGRLYQMVVARILAPDLLGYLGFGVEINDQEARRLQSQSTVPLDITFSHRHISGRWLWAASTLPANLRVELLNVLDRLKGEQGPRQDLPIIELEGERFITLTIPLRTPSDQVTQVVVQHSLSAALRAFHPLFLILLGLAGTGIGITLLGSILIGNSIARPIRTLAGAAERIGQGDYSQPVSIVSRDELGQLGSTFNAMMTGIAEREQQIAFHATHDRLTGLPNRSHFETHLASMIERGGRFSVLLLKVDNFADINNTLGHTIGDALLVRIGERLRVAEISDWIARATHSTFLIFLDHADSTRAMTVANDLVYKFGASVQIDGLVLDITLRAGIVVYPEHGEDHKILLRRAEVALAASQGMQRSVLYDPGKDPYRPELLSLMTDLRTGLETGELTFFYQPKIDLISGTIHKVEALVRWHHPRHGFVSPDRFIPMAERTGHIYHLTRWGITQALRDTQRWRSHGLDLTAAINLATADLLDVDLPGLMARELDRHGLTASDLAVEVTESSAMENPSCAIEQLAAIQAMGIRIAIDDYGAGYSSLAYIKRLPVDEIKIDKMFVMDLATNENDEVIVRTTIELGHNLGLKVTAEGVENEESLAKLRHFGCDFGQGYFFSRPIPVDQLEKWLREKREFFRREA